MADCDIIVKRSTVLLGESVALGDLGLVQGDKLFISPGEEEEHIDHLKNCMLVVGNNSESKEICSSCPTEWQPNWADLTQGVPLWATQPELGWS